MRKPSLASIASVLFLFFTGAFISCNETDVPGTDPDNFDRSAMLANWADNIILPAYQDYNEKTGILRSDGEKFTASPDLGSLEQLRSAWIEAYKSWQYVSMFEIGKAEMVALRDYTNTYPTDAAAIQENITGTAYNLELPSTRDQQGFPALDYLLYGLADTEEQIVKRYVDNPSYGRYLTALLDRLDFLSSAVKDDWQDYRDVFVQNSGSDASASVNKMVNDYMFYYEKSLRAGKIGIPAGVFSNTPLSDRVEAYYNGTISRALFLTALQASIDFYNGKHFNSETKGESLNSYLEYLSNINQTEGEPLNNTINQQFDKAMAAGEQLMDDLGEQVESNNDLMLITYDELQKNVVLMKVDMFQAMNIQVDYVDADGD